MKKRRGTVNVLAHGHQAGIFCIYCSFLVGMNPLTQIKNQQKATQREIAAGFSESASWHAKFRHSAYVFAGGLPYTLTEGDVLAVFSQYGEVVDVNLVRCGCTPTSL